MSYDPNQPYEHIPYNDANSQSPATPPQPEQPSSATPYPSYANPSFYNQPVQPNQPNQPYGPAPMQQPGQVMPPMPPQPMPPYQPYMPPQSQPYIPPQFQPQPPQPKKSRKWLWITLSVIGGVILLGCIGCGVLVATSFGSISQVFGPSFVTGEYYAAIEKQQYNVAYGFLDSNASITINGQTVQNNEAAFAQAAEAMDSKYGPVTNISVQPNTQNFNQIEITVTRGNNPPYVVTLNFVRTNGSTKIASISNI